MSTFKFRVELTGPSRGFAVWVKGAISDTYWISSLSNGLNVVATGVRLGKNRFEIRR